MIHHEGHGRMCKIPPIRYFNQEDAIFCQMLANRDDSAGNDEGELHEGDSDDDSCWESLDSDENVSESRTELIYRYFLERAAHRMEQPPFAAFYSE